MSFNSARNSRVCISILFIFILYLKVNKRQIQEIENKTEEKDKEKPKKPKDPEKEFNLIIENINKLYKAGLIHADLSEYNILMGKKIYFIDFAQGTIKNNVMAQDFLKRDVENITRFYSNYIEVSDVNETLKGILNE